VNQAISAPLYAGALLVGMLLLLEIGRRIGLRRLAKDPKATDSGLGPAEGTLFALFGLLLAFTFSGAADRFNSRRMLIADEANAVGTAWLRLDLLPAESQPELRAAFRDYLGSRLAVYAKLPDLEAAMAEIARSEKMQGAIWSGAVAATRREGGHPDAARLLLPALNEMIDITTTRTMAARIHPPFIVYALLFVLGLASALLAGVTSAATSRRSWLHIVGFALATAVVVYVIVDIEFPRWGLFRIDTYDQVLVDLQKTMQ
jgi:hypothetical protein